MKNERNSLKVIYASSYDRGLDILLSMWPMVYKEVKKRCKKPPELHIFYGWQLWDAVNSNYPDRLVWKAKQEEGMKTKGVFHHGRVSKKDLIEHFKISSVWAYPTYFGEISCITAMDAQVYGALPVVVNYAALKETVQFGDKIEGDIYDTKIQEKFKDQLIHRLVWCYFKKDDAEVLRREMMKWARETFSWSGVAKSWTEDLFEKSSKENIDWAKETLVNYNPQLREFLYAKR